MCRLLFVGVRRASFVAYCLVYGFAVCRWLLAVVCWLLCAVCCVLFGVWCVVLVVFCLERVSGVTCALRVACRLLFAISMLGGCVVCSVACYVFNVACYVLRVEYLLLVVGGCALFVVSRFGVWCSLSDVCCVLRRLLRVVCWLLFVVIIAV